MNAPQFPPIPERPVWLEPADLAQATGDWEAIGGEPSMVKGRRYSLAFSSGLWVLIVLGMGFFFSWIGSF